MTEILEDINKNATEKDNVQDVSTKLKHTLVKGGITKSRDVKLVSDIMTKILNVTANDSIVVENIIQTVSEVLKAPDSLIGKSEIENQTSQIILEQLDYIGKSQHLKRNAKITFQSENIAFLAFRNSQLKNVTIFSQNSSTDAYLQQTNRILANAQMHNQYATALLPSSLFNPNLDNGDYVHAFVFNNGKLFLPEKQVGKIYNATHLTKPKQTVQSKVLSVTVGHKKITNLTDNVTMTFKKNIHFPAQYNENVCQFWDEVVRAWSTEGCFTLQSENDDFVKCECNHLTNFALILDTSQTGNNTLALEIVSWIGCAVSIVSLLLTLSTLLIFRKSLVTGKLPPKILIGLCLSLLCTMVTFLVGVERTENRSQCRVFAALIQYFLLTTFCWMAVEGINLYRNFVTPVQNITANKKRFMILATIFAIGLPLTITAISATVDPNNYGPINDDDKYQL